MFVWIVAGATLTFYLFFVPVKLALVLHLHAHPAFGAGASVFESRFAFKSARRRAEGAKKISKKRKMPRLDKSCAFSALLKSVKYLLKHVKLEKLQAQGYISAPDAAQTALICGSAHMLDGALSPLLPPDTLHLHLKPDFSALHSDVHLCGIISACAGHIMLAVLIGAWNYFSRRKSNGKTSH